MNDLTFLNVELANEYGDSNAILKVVLPGGKVIHIADIINPIKFLESCPLLYHAFELNAQDRLQAGIEATSEAAIISLVRYCYTGSYLAGEPEVDSVQLLQHAETYKIAEDFDVPELQIMAHGNFSCQIEYACCLPQPPADLLDTIRFIYRNFASDEARRKHNLVDTLLNYCVAVYLIHKLGENLDFLTAIHELPAFRQDLCRTNIVRNFEDDCATHIIRLPANPIAESSKAPTTLASRELPTEMYYDFPRVPPTTNSSTAFANSTIFQQSTQPTMLAYRRSAVAAQPRRQEIPDPSKHCVSPIDLAAALTKYRDPKNDSDSDDTQGEDVFKESLRKYKRARFDDTTARLADKSVLHDANPSGNNDKTRTRAATIEDEDLYWVGAFDDTTTKASASTFPPREPHPHNATTTHIPSTLPHRPRALAPSDPDTGFTTDTASEDEDFALIHKIEKSQTHNPNHLPSSSATAPQSNSPNSSPVLVPSPSPLTAETLIPGCSRGKDKGKGKEKEQEKDKEVSSRPLKKELEDEDDWTFL